MARLEISVKHGQPPELAEAKFQAAVRDVESRFSGWIKRLDWAEDGRSATFTGSGFEVRTWYDERDLHIQGSIPLAWKLLEGMIRGQVKNHIDRALPAHDQ
jgi:Putative polyhydroxyalkanoic acid system protein (PHA_gran_rgn)